MHLLPGLPLGSWDVLRRKGTILCNPQFLTDKEDINVSSVDQGSQGSVFSQAHELDINLTSVAPFSTQDIRSVGSWICKTIRIQAQESPEMCEGEFIKILSKSPYTKFPRLFE